MASVFGRRRKRRELVRLLVALDEAARDVRPWRPRRVLRAGLAVRPTF